MTGADLLKEVLMHAPELRGSTGIVYGWINQAIRDIESVEDWEFMLSFYSHEFAGDGTPPLNISSERPKKLFKVVLQGRELVGTAKFEEFELLAVSGDDPAFWGFENGQVYWKPSVTIADGEKIEIWFYKKSGDVEETTSDNWLLNNSFETVKYKVLASAMSYLKNVDMANQYLGMFNFELNALRQRFGIPVPEQQTQAQQGD